VSFKVDPHTPKKMLKHYPWAVCTGCGLVFLNNPITRWCVSKGCLYDEHPDYNKKMKELAR
jgi:hypothetical protein